MWIISHKGVAEKLEVNVPVKLNLQILHKILHLLESGETSSKIMPQEKNTPTAPNTPDYTKKSILQCLTEPNKGITFTS